MADMQQSFPYLVVFDKAQSKIFHHLDFKNLLSLFLSVSNILPIVSLLEI